MNSHSSHRCRSCAAPHLTTILNLGRTPLANGLLTGSMLHTPEPTYPLELAVCRNCTLVQILETVPPEELFSEYLYQSSWSDTMLAHARTMAAELAASLQLGPRSLVVEAASNDGYLLQFYQQVGIPVLGIEPARNIAAIAQQQRGIPTLIEFFNQRVAQRLCDEGRRADLFHAHNVLAHVADLNGFVQGIATLLSDTGAAVIEAPYVRDLVEHCEFDTIYHEHLCYFSLTALDQLFRRHRLAIVDVRKVEIHGGSLRITARPASAAVQPNQAVRDLLAAEARDGLTSLPYYRNFAARVETLRNTLRTTLAELKQQGRRIAAYGASAKGSTLLNYCGIGPETLDYVVDRSPLKQGRFTPGQHLQICDPARLLEDQPDYLLLLTWNFAEEILRQQAEYRRRGGRFITPVPEIRVA